MSVIEATNTTLLSDEEQLRDQFYQWDIRGRGWQLYEGAVELEPAFLPFFGYTIANRDCADDGRKHTLISGLIEWLHQIITTRSSSPPISPAEGDDDEGAYIWMHDVESLIELQLNFPASFDPSDGIVEQLLVGLNGCERPPTFEIIGTAERLAVQIACAEGDADLIEQQVRTYFPAITISRADRFLKTCWYANESDSSVIVELGLAQEFVLPLAFGSSAVDPLTSLIGVLANMPADEVALLQVLFEPVRHPWAESMLRSVTLQDGKPIFRGVRDFLKQTRAKVSRPLYAAVVRVAAKCADRTQAIASVRKLVSALSSLNSTDGNELIPLDNDGYDDADHEDDLLARRSRRTGMLLNSAELVMLVHPPIVSVDKLRGNRKTTAAPASVVGGRFVLGINEHAGVARHISLSPDQRSRHTHIVGASGTGKSTLLLNLILQDIQSGDGVAVLDPHGDLIDNVIARLPPDRLDDVVLLDPADEEYPVGFNVLSAHSPQEKNLLASDLVGIFRRLSTSWGDQLNAVFANAILAFLENTESGTLVDLRRFLVERDFRQKLLKTVTDPEIVYYWEKEFSLLKARPQGPVLTRLDTFLRPKSIRYMVGQKANMLDFADIMDSGKIFLARLSQGAIGQENAHLLGALLVAKFNQIALSRQRMRECDRRYCWLYLDEFQHFATPSVAELLSGIRKYRLGLILAHQELHQLESRSPELASAVLSNAYTRICFRVGDHDAKKLEHGFASFEAMDLQKLGTGEAVCRVERADFDFNMRVEPPPTIDADAADRVRSEVVTLSRKMCAASRRAVEEALSASSKTTDVSTNQDTHAAESISPTTTPPAAIPAPPVDIPRPRSRTVRQAQDKTAVKKIVPFPPPMPEPALQGRGGPEHKYLQHMVKQWAEGMGYRATIEKEVLGSRSIDVAIEREGMSIACEITMTTTPEWELGNVQKCLAGGYMHVVVLSGEAKQLSKLKKSIDASLSDDERTRIHFFVPDELFAFIQELEIKNIKQQTLRGYKVTRGLRAVDPADAHDRRQVVSRVVAGSIKRMRERKR